MKKLFLLIGLAISMSFALNISDKKVDYSSGVTSVNFKLYNESSSSINIKGYRVFVYVARMEDEGRPQLLSLDCESCGSIESAKATWEDHVSDYVYEVSFSFSNVTILAGGKSDVSLKLVGGWFMYPNDHTRTPQYIVVEDAKGNVIYGEHPDFKSRIGLLLNGPYCPDNAFTYVLHLNAENKNNGTKILNGVKSSSIVIETSGDFAGDVGFRYCEVIMPKLPRIAYSYAVLRLDDECPEGSFPFRRVHDTQDKETSGLYNGFVRPNDFGKNASLEYCYVPANPNSTVTYPVDKNYAVFANYSSVNVSHTELYFDDENNDNVNSWYWYNYPGMRYGVNLIISGTNNTIYNIINWTENALAKASDVDAPSVAESQISAASAAAASIKGFSRTAVNVELESAGNVEVSVMGINGAVVAKIVKENLQAGSHDINWNLANVPNGRYIVAVKHNGKMSAKNVILK